MHYCVQRPFCFLQLENELSITYQEVSSDSHSRDLIPKTKQNRGHVLPKPPLIDINQPGRLRSKHVMALCGISHSTLYLRQKQQLFPKPDGKDGGLNYWNTKTIKAYLDNDNRDGGNK